MVRSLRLGAVGLLLLGTAACTNPYDPGQRAVGGGLLGAGAGAAIAGVTDGNVGAGALIGGALGAVGGAVTTPRQPEYGYRDDGYRGRGYARGRRDAYRGW